LDLKEIKELIALMRKNDLSEFKLEQENFKITLRRGVDFPAYPQQALAPALPYAAQAAPAAATSTSASAETPAAPREKLREIVSPMVGTFYASSSPDAPAYVTAGREVTEDTVVCIIEAMKVMNEIKAELCGTIVEVVAENGKPVQYGQVLFRVR
jgi:acetyl-CoA carboxylase biotin carboxyl carrier protein